VTRFDPGLQPERTALAWRRTALAVAVGSLAAGRLVEPMLEGAWLLTAAGVALGFGMLLAARRRADLIDRALRTDGDLTAGPGAGLIAAATVVAAVAGVAGLVVVGT
jgi:uncharacterized membrane protein YidH (DUF202 family)